MTDPSLDESARLLTGTTGDGIEPEDPPIIEYPDTTVGLLMKQRDEARASAKSDRLFADQLCDRATATDAQADRLDEAIALLGGEPPA